MHLKKSADKKILIHALHYYKKHKNVKNHNN